MIFVKVELMSFKSVVIAGGALKVISAIGCLQYLYEKKCYDKIINYVGTSAGALISFFAVLGYTPTAMIEFIKTHLYTDDISQFNIEEAFNMFESYGLSSGESINKFTREILRSKMGVEDISFIDLAKKTGKNLVVCVSNLSKERCEFLGVDTEPDMSVLLAIRISCSLPLIFAPITYKDDIYLDGVMYNNFPIDYFKGSTLRDIFGINIMNPSYQKTGNLFEYLTFIIYTLLEKSQQYKQYASDHEKNIVTINMEDPDWFSIMDLKITFPKESIDAYFLQGYNAACEQLTA
jgi:predicted acylesterase/phospholipase RssA